MSLHYYCLIAAVVVTFTSGGSEAKDLCAVDGAPLSFANVPTLNCPSVKQVNVGTGHVTQKNVQIGWCRTVCSGIGFLNIVDADSKHPCLFGVAYITNYGKQPTYHAATKDVHFTLRAPQGGSRQDLMAQFSVACDPSLPANTTTCPREVRKDANFFGSTVTFQLNSSAVCL